jgi:hypothetical protein
VKWAASQIKLRPATCVQASCWFLRNDIPATVEAFDRQIEWTEPADHPGAGTYRGQAALSAHLSWARGTWAEGSCEAERFIVAGENIIVFVHVRVRLKDRMDWIKARLAEVPTFRSSKPIQMCAFGDRRQAPGSVGVTALDANRPCPP